ncbi:MAG: hypothetical protein U9N34_05620 [Candidatus Cloacimonadota bacterium]|nr:hypothetical protein [Candidatus Cloacimonadota bacterium]
MEKKKNAISEKVENVVIMALHTGEDVIKSVGNITKDIIKTTKDDDLNSKEKASKLASDALNGVKGGYEKAKPKSREFIKSSKEKITETFNEKGPVVAKFAKDVYNGIIEGTKKVISEHKNKNENEDSEQDKQEKE